MLPPTQIHTHFLKFKVTKRKHGIFLFCIFTIHFTHKCVQAVHCLQPNGKQIPLKPCNWCVSKCVCVCVCTNLVPDLELQFYQTLEEQCQLLMGCTRFHGKALWSGGSLRGLGALLRFMFFHRNLM